MLRSDARPRELAGPHSDIPSISFILGPSSSWASFRGSNRGQMGLRLTRPFSVWGQVPSPGKPEARSVTASA